MQLYGVQAHVQVQVQAQAHGQDKTRQGQGQGQGCSRECRCCLTGAATPAPAPAPGLGGFAAFLPSMVLPDGPKTARPAAYLLSTIVLQYSLTRALLDSGL